MEPIIKKKISLQVNGEKMSLEVRVNEMLVDVLRERLGLTGAKIGCNAGECGACTVLVNGEPILSCLTLAVDCEGKEIATVEGLADSKTGKLHPIQDAFIEHHGLQCGFCTSGMILSAKVLLDENKHPSEKEIREAINGNICRCTGYVSIVESISAAAESMENTDH